MNSLVILHPLRDPASFTVSRKAQKIFVHREQYSLNPSDKNALEAALRLGGSVTALALGGAPAEDYLRLARAIGVQRAVQIKAPAIPDAGAVVSVLQNALEQLEPVDLILLGAEVLDADLAQVGPRLAQERGWAFIAHAHTLTVDEAVVRAIVRTPDGFHQVEADLPAVIAVAPDSNKPRYAHGRDIMRFYQSTEAVEVMEADEIVSNVEARGESYPPERELGVWLSGAVPELARQVADVIRTS